jgi:phosphate starvation-inducible PhoH-like protein
MQHLTNEYLKSRMLLKPDQQNARMTILENAVSIITGNGGTGKTAIAAYTAADLLLSTKLQQQADCTVKRIVFITPIPDNDELGYLRGTLEEKLKPRTDYFKKIIYDFYSDRGKIEYHAITHTMGATFDNAFIILDEAQNATHAQMKLVISRLGKRSKLVICGDVKQIALKDPTTSGLPFLLGISRDVDGMDTCELTTNNRHQIIDKILHFYSY